MPRKARIDMPGALHHLIIRGIERGRIFRDDQDRNSFLGRLGKILAETKTPCYAWALLPNHCHLLLRTGKVPLASVMGRLLTGYAVNFNHKYRRHGQLFQNRYKSILCQEDSYFLELVRYIHLNPLRAKVVRDYTPDCTCSESILLLGGEGTWHKFHRDCQEAQSYSAGGEYFGKERGANRQRKRADNTSGIEFYNFMDVPFAPSFPVCNGKTAVIFR